MSLRQSNGVCYITAYNEKDLHVAYRDNTLLEDAKLVIYEDGSFSISGVKISAFCYMYTWFDNTDYVKELRLICDPVKDFRKSRWSKRMILKNGLYEMEDKNDFHMDSNVPWVIEYSNGEMLSPAELA